MQKKIYDFIYIIISTEIYHNGVLI